jgi:hypothetical protein
MKPGLRSVRPAPFVALAGATARAWPHRARLGAAGLQQRFQTSGPWAPLVFTALCSCPGLLEAGRSGGSRNGAEVRCAHRAVIAVA